MQLVNNRLGDLLSPAYGTFHEQHDDVVVNVSEDNKDDELNEDGGNVELDTLTSGFFQEVGQVKALTLQIKQNVAAIQIAYNKQIWNSDSSTGSKKAGELEQLLETTNAAVTQVRNKLKQMKADRSTDKADRDRKSKVISVLTKKFMNLMQEYQTVQTNYKDKSRESFKRTAEIVKPGITMDEVNGLIESGDSKSLFSQQTLDDHRKNQANNALNFIQEQKRDIQQLERSINILHQLFIDMQTITESHGDLLDDVQDNVHITARRTIRAVKDLTVVDKMVQRGRKRKCMFVTVAVIIAIVIGVVIAGSVMGFI